MFSAFMHFVCVEEIGSLALGYLLVFLPLPNLEILPFCRGLYDYVPLPQLL